MNAGMLPPIRCITGTDGGYLKDFLSMFVESVTYSAAFIAGLLSFFSPCILPLIPAYFTYITGFSLEDLTGEASFGLRARVVLSTVFYVMGFSTVFILLGVMSSLLGGLVHQYAGYVRVFGGILLIVFGLHLLGWFRLRWLEFERRVEVRGKPLTLVGTFVVGMAFGAGWSPCIGPILGSILTIAATQGNVFEGAFLLLVYSAGLAVPFLLISCFIHYLIVFVRKSGRLTKYINTASGWLLVLLGILLISDKLSFLAV
jgi:cytochrome c-type biogenesis protein